MNVNISYYENQDHLTNTNHTHRCFIRIQCHILRQKNKEKLYFFFVPLCSFGSYYEPINNKYNKNNFIYVSTLKK